MRYTPGDPKLKVPTVGHKNSKSRLGLQMCWLAAGKSMGGHPHLFLGHTFRAKVHTRAHGKAHVHALTQMYVHTHPPCPWGRSAVISRLDLVCKRVVGTHVAVIHHVGGLTAQPLSQELSCHYSRGCQFRPPLMQGGSPGSLRHV